MPALIAITEIVGPIEFCFDLARDVEVHCRTSAFSGEKAVGGITSGLLGLGDTITFEGVHFGVRQRLTARIVEFDRPNRFADEMVSGAFRSLRHEHEFAARGEVTVMTDIINWESPFGPIGRVADLFVGRHLKLFLRRRNLELKRIAEDSMRTN